MANAIKKLFLKWKNDKNFQREVGLYTGAVTNLFFVGVEFYGGIRYQSNWFIALAVYNLVLTIVKFYLGISAHKEPGNSDWRTFKIAGIVMVTINLALFAMISIMIADPSIALHEYSKTVAIVMAVWTVYTFVGSIRDLVKLRGKNDPWLLAIGMVNLVGTIVSVLMLQTAMIASFGTGSGEDLIGNAVQVVDKAGEVVWLPINGEMIMNDKTLGVLASANRITGVAVGALILGITVYMIVRGAREEKS